MPVSLEFIGDFSFDEKNSIESALLKGLHDNGISNISLGQNTQSRYKFLVAGIEEKTQQNNVRWRSGLSIKFMYDNQTLDSDTFSRTETNRDQLIRKTISDISGKTAFYMRIKGILKL